jgi:hypothetical protein
MRLKAVHGIVTPALVALAITTTGCSNTSAMAAQQAAERACAESRVEISDLLVRDVDSLDDTALKALASQASDRADSALTATDLDSRWNILSEATTIIAQFASQMVQMSERGIPPSQALDLSAWDTYKAASNAYRLECRVVLDRGSSHTSR